MGEVFTSRKCCDAGNAKAFCLENLLTLLLSRIPCVRAPLDPLESMLISLISLGLLCQIFHPDSSLPWQNP